MRVRRVDATVALACCGHSPQKPNPRSRECTRAGTKHLPSFFTCPLSACAGADSNRAPKVTQQLRWRIYAWWRSSFLVVPYNLKVAFTYNKTISFIEKDGNKNL